MRKASWLIGLMAYLWLPIYPIYIADRGIIEVEGDHICQQVTVNTMELLVTIGVSCILSVIATGLGWWVVPALPGQRSISRWFELSIVAVPAFAGIFYTILYTRSYFLSL